MFNPFWDYTEPEPILREVFSDIGDPLSVSLFAQIRLAWQGGDQEQNVPWGDSVEDGILDMEYLLNHSGGKFCAPIIKSLIKRGGAYVNDDGTLSTQSVYILAKIIVGKYKQNWQHLWDVNTASYNPINNYDMVEVRTTNGASSESKVSTTYKLDEGTETNEYGKEETVNHGKTADDMTYRYGINTDTSDPKPSEKGFMQEGGSTVTTDGGSDTRTTEMSSGSDSTSSAVGATEEQEELHRSGNIGVTTTQKMIEEERRLWVWNYFDQIFSDLDNVLALSFHDPCRV